MVQVTLTDESATTVEFPGVYMWVVEPCGALTVQGSQANNWIPTQSFHPGSWATVKYVDDPA